MAQVHSMVSFLCNIRNIPDEERYIGITAHFIDESWQRQAVLLNYYAMERVPDGEILAINIFASVCNQFDLKHRQGGIMTPSSHLLYKFSEAYDAHMGPDSQAQHLCCFAYAMVDALVEFVWCMDVSRLSRAIEYVYETQESVQQLKRTCTQLTPSIAYVERPEVEDDSACDRWTATFDVLEWAMALRPAFVTVLADLQRVRHRSGLTLANVSGETSTSCSRSSGSLATLEKQCWAMDTRLSLSQVVPIYNKLEAPRVLHRQVRNTRGGFAAFKIAARRPPVLRRARRPLQGVKRMVHHRCGARPAAQGRVH